MSNVFSGDRLRLARILNGNTLQELGDLVGITRQGIHQYEVGGRLPPADTENALAEKLGVETSFFYMHTTIDVKSEQCHFRKRKTTPQGIANRVLAFSTILEQLVSKLHSFLDLPESQFGFVDSDKISDLSAPIIEKIAEAAREYWGLPTDAPIDNMVNVAERAGAVVACFDGVSDKVDALSVNRTYPLIIRNSFKSSICRMRFDIAHECGHLIMHDGIETGCKKTESEADSFASAFLFPRKSFAREFPACLSSGKIIWPEVYKLKQRWKVSARAIIYRAHFLGFINAQVYRGANIWFSNTRQTKSEKGDDLIQPESPHILSEALSLLENELGIKADSLAKDLGVSVGLLSNITGLDIKPASKECFDDVVVPFKY